MRTRGQWAAAGLLAGVGGLATSYLVATLLGLRGNPVTDVAELVGCSRQNIRKLMLGHPATFPAAVHEGSQAFWHLRPVLAWFAETQSRPIDRTLLEVSEVAMKVNIAREARKLPGAAVPRELEVLFA